MLWIVDHLLIATFATVVIAIIFILSIFLALNRHYPHEATRPAVGTAIVSVLVAVLFSVILNNFYAIKRDRDNRLRNFRDQHYAQLRPVLRAESSKLTDLVQQITNWAHIARVDRFENIQGDPSTMLWPDVMSHDLENHFPDYEHSKIGLLSAIDAQDKEFREAIATAERAVKSRKGTNSYWLEVVAVSYVEKCLGRGNGVQLRVTPSGYNFESWGGLVGASGSGPNPPRPSDDQIAAFRAFTSLTPNDTLVAHCRSLKDRADAIRRTAEQLSKEAQLLSAGTILERKCRYLSSGNLSD